MYNPIMIANYLMYLKFIDNKINNFFEKQKPYIFCHKGCAKCCKGAQFPYSYIELRLLLSGFLLLDKEKQNTIEKNVQKVLNEKENYTGKKFMYDCPFLIDNVCSVYEYRGLICRAFGLLTKSNKGLEVPFCCHEGLNFSNVLEEGTTMISRAKVEKLENVEEPVAFNISYEFLTDDDFAKGFDFEFGEKKPLIEWFEDKQILNNRDL